MRAAVGTSLVLASMFILAAVPALRAEEALGLGRKITTELHSIIVEHREALREAIAEYKVAKRNLHEEKVQVLKEFIEDSKRLRDEVKAEIGVLRDLFRAGNITEEEYVSKLRILTARLQSLGKSSDKLGKVLSELARKTHEAVREKVEELRRVNEDFGKSVAETARTVGETARQEAVNRRANATETHGPPGNSRGRGRAG